MSKKENTQKTIPTRFRKASPYAIPSLAIEAMKNALAPSVFVLLDTISTDNIAYITQTQLSHLLHTDYRRIHYALQQLIKDNYVVAAKIRSSRANVYLINPNILWIYRDGEVKNPINDDVDFRKSYELAVESDPNLYGQIRKYHHRTFALIKDYSITPMSIKQHQVDAEGRLVCQVTDSAQKAISRAKSVSSNFFFALSAIHAPHLYKIVAKYLFDHMSSNTFTIQTNNSALYKSMHRNRIQIGYVTVSKTLSFLRNEGLIERPHRNTICISSKLIKYSKHSNMATNHRLVQETKNQINQKSINKVNESLMNRKRGNA